VLLGLVVTLAGSVLGWTAVRPVVVYGWFFGGLCLTVWAIVALSRVVARTHGTPRSPRFPLILYSVLLLVLLVLALTDPAFEW
jgi:hypothetical protein